MTLFTEPQPNLERDIFLAYFEPRRRSHVSNLFLNFGPRSGQREPSAIVAAVLSVLQECLDRNGYESQIAVANEVKTIIEAHPDDARNFARWAVKYHLLPDQEREAGKRQQQQEHVSRWLSNQPASPKQIAYIRSLGHKGDVVSKLQASQIIEQLKSGGKR